MSIYTKSTDIDTPKSAHRSDTTGLERDITVECAGFDIICIHIICNVCLSKVIVSYSDSFSIVF